MQQKRGGAKEAELEPLVGLFRLLRLTGDNHFHVSNHSAGPRVCIEHRGITNDIEVVPRNRGPLLGTKNLCR